MTEAGKAGWPGYSGIVYAPGASPAVERPAAAAGAAAAFTSGGGRLLASIRVHLIFWGQAWARLPAPTPTVGQCTDAVVTIVASDYMRSLGQYGVGTGTLGSVTVVHESVGGSLADPPNPFSNDDVWQLIEHLRAAGRIPVSDISGGQGLYCVVMPNGVASNQSGVIGEHSYYTLSGSPNVPFAWVTQNSLDDFSVVFSHELVEACTDPEGSGWTSATACGAGHGGWCEIGDVCQGNDARISGVLVQRYWSNSDNQCVVPDDPKVAQDNKIHKDSKDSKDSKDHKDRKELKDGAKEKESRKELKDGAKELERPVGATVTDQLRQIAQQLQDLASTVAGEEEGTEETFIQENERPEIGA